MNKTYTYPPGTLTLTPPHFAQQSQAEIVDEIERGRLEVAKLRAKLGGGRLGSLELGPLMLPNPGGGQV